MAGFGLFGPNDWAPAFMNFVIVFGILLLSFFCVEKAVHAWRTGQRTFSGLIAGFFLLGWIANLNGLLFEWYSLGPNGDVPGAVFCCWTVLVFFLMFESLGDDSPLGIE
jgi:hypothetical protein